MRPNAKQSRITISALPAVIDSPVVSTDYKDHPRTPTLVGAGSPPPTFSNASVHFYNTTDLRSNQPFSQSGADSPGLLGPNSHRRKGLSTNPDTDNIAPNAPKSPRLGDVVDPTPHAFRPNSSANLIVNNAKYLDALEQMGSAGELVWKRTVNDAVCRFLQFRISVNITAVIITFVTAIASSTESSVLTTVQLLWINVIIMDTFAALALATDPASRDVFDRMPDRMTALSFNTAMRMQIIGQSMYQTFIILLFHFAGDIIFGYDKSAHTELQIQQWHSELNTLAFNAFVFCQIFNLINSRRIDSKNKVFAGIEKNFYFIIITLIEVAAQIVIAFAFVGGAAFSFHHLNGKSGRVSLAFGFGSLPLGFLVRLIPEEPVERIFRKLALMQDSDILQVESSENQDKRRNLSVIQPVKDERAVFFCIRGDTTSTSPPKHLMLVLAGENSTTPATSTPRSLEDESRHLQ